MVTFRWILYVQTNGVPGGGDDPTRVASLDDARDWFERLSRDTGIEDCSGFLYPYSDEDFDLAEEFAGIGNPFDYPTKVIERGPRNGINVRNA